MADPSNDDLIRRLDQNYTDTQNQVARLKTVSRTFSILTVLVFLGFLWALVTKIGEQWEPKRLQALVAYEVDQLDEPLLTAVQVAATEVSPVYQEMASKEFEKLIPELEKEAVKEIDGLVKGIMATAGKKVEAAIERVELKQRELVMRQFPKATLPAEDPIGLLGTEEERREDLLLVMRAFMNRYQDDVAKLQETLGGFRNDAFDRMSKDTLMRYFAHLWLMLLDRHLMQKDLEKGGTYDR